MAVTDSQQSSGRGQCSGGGIEAIGKAFLVSVRKVVVARGREHKTAQWLRYYDDDCRSRRRRRFGTTVKVGGER